MVERKHTLFAELDTPGRRQSMPQRSWWRPAHHPAATGRAARPPSLQSHPRLLCCQSVLGQVSFLSKEKICVAHLLEPSCSTPCASLLTLSKRPLSSASPVDSKTRSKLLIAEKVVPMSSSPATPSGASLWPTTQAWQQLAMRHSNARVPGDAGCG